MNQEGDLEECLSAEYNPSDYPVRYKDVVVLYLGFLIDSALSALREDNKQHSRSIRFSYTNPLFHEQGRGQWATEILAECVHIGHALVERYSGQWSNGIPLVNLCSMIAQTRESAGRFKVENSILSEPVAAFASRLRRFDPDPEKHERHLMMVIDVGAGTTDFAMFARYTYEGEVRLCRIMGSVETVRIAGDDIDKALLDYLLQQADVKPDHLRYGFIRAGLEREIRLVKEELFRNKSVERQPTGDVKAEAKLQSFEECPAMVCLRHRLETKFNSVLSQIHVSWLSFRKLQVLFTGGGASLSMVTRLARGQQVRVGGEVITPEPVTEPPPWFKKECEDVVDAYSQLAVSIGGAAHSAKKIPLGVEFEQEEFAGDIPDGEWTPDRF